MIHAESQNIAIADSISAKGEPPASDAEAANSFKQIRKSIMEAPFRDLVAIARQSIDCGNISSNALYENAFRTINIIIKKSRIGDETAIKSLLSLGNQITEAVEELIGNEGDPIEVEISNPERYPEETINEKNSHPKISSSDSKFKGSKLTMQRANRHILEVTLRKMPPAPILLDTEIRMDFLEQYFTNRELDTSYRISPPPSKHFPLTSSADLMYISLFVRDHALPPPYVSKPVESVEIPEETDSLDDLNKYKFHEDIPAPPVMIDRTPVLTVHTDSYGNQRIKTYGTLEAAGLANEIIEREICLRISHVTRRIVRRIAKHSRSWPVKAAAPSDQRGKIMDNYITSLNLGTSVPIIFQHTPEARKTRGSNTRSEMEFTVELLEQIFIERDARLPQSKPNGWPPRNELSNDETLNTQINEFIHNSAWSSETRWIRLATFLPTLSNDPDIKNDWLTATLELAKTRCQGEWESYSWPECVVNRSNRFVIQKDPRSNHSIIKSILKNGIDRLTAPISHAEKTLQS